MREAFGVDGLCYVKGHGVRDVAALYDRFHAFTARNADVSTRARVACSSIISDASEHASSSHGDRVSANRGSLRFRTRSVRTSTKASMS